MNKALRSLVKRIVCTILLLGLLSGALPASVYATESEPNAQTEQENISTEIKYVDHTKRGFDIRGVVNGQEVNLTTGGEGFSLYISGYDGFSKLITDIELNKDYVSICDGKKIKICLTPEIKGNELTINVGIEAIDKYYIPHRFDYFIAAPVNFQGTNNTKLSYDDIGGPFSQYSRRIQASNGYCHLYIDSESSATESWIGRACDMAEAIKNTKGSSCGAIMPAAADNALYTHQYSFFLTFHLKTVIISGIHLM